MSAQMCLPEEPMIKKGIEALMAALGPVETARFLTLPRHRYADYGEWHRQWQETLDPGRQLDAGNRDRDGRWARRPARLRPSLRPPDETCGTSPAKRCTRGWRRGARALSERKPWRADDAINPAPAAFIKESGL